MAGREAGRPREQLYPAGGPPRCVSRTQGDVAQVQGGGWSAGDGHLEAGM